MTFLDGYLLIGLGVWAGVSVCNLWTFKDATAWAVIKGVACGLIFWPAALIFVASTDKPGGQRENS